MFNQRFATCLVVLLLSLKVSAQVIQLGDEAPSLSGGKALVGKAIDDFAPGRVYVVSFWSSQVAQRPDALPLILQIAQANPKDVTCVCVRSNESEEFDDLIRHGGPGNLRVINDNPDEDTPGPVVERWLQRVNINSYPVTFIVDKQRRICFVGDIAAAAELVGDVVSGKRTVETVAHEYEVAEDEFEKAQAEAQGRPARRAAEGDPAGAAAALDAIIEKYPSQRANLLLDKFKLLLQAERFEQAYPITDDLLELHRFDAEELNNLSWFMVDEPSIAQRDLNRALTISKRSNDLSGNRVPAYLDTLARAYFEKGEIEKALELQTKAVELAREGEREQLIPTLERYRNAVPK